MDVCAGWATYPPTTPQYEAMHQCVMELANKVKEARAREVSQVSRKPPSPSRGAPWSSAPPRRVERGGDRAQPVERGARGWQQRADDAPAGHAGQRAARVG